MWHHLTPQYAKCNWIPLSGQGRTANVHTRFLFASGNVPHYSAYHSPWLCNHQYRLSKGQIYSVWINSSGLKSWVTPWLDLSSSLSLNPASLYKFTSINAKKRHNSLWEKNLLSISVMSSQCQSLCCFLQSCMISFISLIVYGRTEGLSMHSKGGTTVRWKQHMVHDSLLQIHWSQESQAGLWYSNLFATNFT